MGAGGAALLVVSVGRGRDPLDPKGRERLHCVWPQRSGSQTRRANVRAPRAHYPEFGHVRQYPDGHLTTRRRAVGDLVVSRGVLVAWLAVG